MRAPYSRNLLKSKNRGLILSVCGLFLISHFSGISKGANLAPSLSSRLNIETAQAFLADQFGSVRPQHEGNHLLLLNLRFTNTVTPELVFEDGFSEPIALPINRFHLMWGKEQFDINLPLFGPQPDHLQNLIQLQYSGAIEQGYLVFEVPIVVPNSATLVFNDRAIGSFLLDVPTDTLGQEAVPTANSSANKKKGLSAGSHSNTNNFVDVNAFTGTKPIQSTIAHGRIDLELAYQIGGVEYAPHGTQFPESAARITLTLGSQLDEPIQAEVRWLAVNVEGVAANKQLSRQRYKLFPKGHRKSQRVFSIRAKGGWQRLGTYRAEIAVNGKVIHSQPFSVISGVPAPPLQPSTNRKTGFNVALSALGGQADYFTNDKSAGQVAEDPRWQLSNLIDGAPYFATDGSRFQSCTRCGWKWPSRNLPIDLRFSFYQKRAARVSSVTIDTRTLEAEMQSGSLPKHIEVWLGKGDFGTTPVRAAAVRLARQTGKHLISFPPDTANWVQLRIVSAHEFGATRDIAIGEVEIGESPKQQSTIVAALRKNIALASLGGGISRFSPGWQTRQDGLAQLIDLTTKVNGARTAQAQFPETLVFSFNESREAGIAHLALGNTTQHDATTWPKRVAIATSPFSPVSDFSPVGEFVLPRSTGIWTTPIHRRARYLRLSILENYGGPYTSLGTVSITEETAETTSILLRESDETQKQATFTLPGATLMEIEPNDGITNAIPVPIGKTFGGAIDSPSDRDIYKFSIRGKRQRLAAQISAAPYLGLLIQLKDSHDKVLERHEPGGDATQNGEFAWTLEPGDYFLEISQPPISVVLLWDGSGSMADQLEHLRNGVKTYLQRMGDNERVSLGRFAGQKVKVFLEDFTSDPGQAWQVVQDGFTAGGGTPLYRAVERAIQLLEDRLGNKAVILMTDGIDNKPPAATFWNAISDTPARFYTIGLGPDQDVFFRDRASHGKRLLEDIARATGGRHFRINSSDQLPSIYAAISSELQRPLRYRVSLTPSTKTGALQVIARDRAPKTNSTENSGNSTHDEQDTATAREGGVAPSIHLEIIFDASGSMRLASSGEPRITSAKRALKGVLQSLDSKNIALALRAYGFDTSLEYGKESTCENTELLVDFEKGSPSSIIRAVNPLQTYGHTPIARSLRLAGRDLEPFKNGRPIILLISDGKESCDGDPVAEIRRLNDRGLKVQIHVVGFDLDKAARTQLRDLAHASNGNYYDAGSYRDLSESLNQAAKVINLTADEALGEKATSSTITIDTDPVIFELLDNSGAIVTRDRVGNTVSELIPGVYSLRILQKESHVIIRNVIVETNKTTIIRP